MVLERLFKINIQFRKPLKLYESLCITDLQWCDCWDTLDRYQIHLAENSLKCSGILFFFGIILQGLGSNITYINSSHLFLSLPDLDSVFINDLYPLFVKYRCWTACHPLFFLYGVTNYLCILWYCNRATKCLYLHA